MRIYRYLMPLLTKKLAINLINNNYKIKFKTMIYLNNNNTNMQVDKKVPEETLVVVVKTI